MINLKKNIDNDLNKQLIDSNMLLNNLAVLNEDDRESYEYTHDKNYSFWYYLGKYIKPKSVLEINTDLGLRSACFLKSCKTVKLFIFHQFKEDRYYSKKIAISNIKKNYKNSFLFFENRHTDGVFLDSLNRKFDLIFINKVKDNDIFKYYLELTWNCLVENGIMVIDYYNKINKLRYSEISSFCKANFILSCEIATKNGVAILRKE